MYRGALRSILAELNRQGRLKIVPQFGVDAPRTKDLIGKLDQLEATGKTLIVAESVDEKLYLAARNHHKVIDVVDVNGLNPVALVGADHVVMTVDAVKKIEEWLA
jgi:large subunit ribosomal protein L4